ncbi:MAG: DUF3467 domain-containing protein [Methanolobus sp.]|jgi:ADP-glucose pyrophosphorylase|nr:DUF3467 domain-containing protein [Methanolobus sp.]
MEEEIVIEESVDDMVSDGGNKKMAIVRTPLFNKTYATNVSVVKTDSDFRVELFNEKFETKDESVYHSDGLVILTNQAAKKLLMSLTDAINDYEEENGEIVVSEKRMSCE